MADSSKQLLKAQIRSRIEALGWNQSELAKAAEKSRAWASDLLNPKKGGINFSTLPRDGKGGFCPGVYLNDDMLAAWQAFINADAFGWFDSGSFARRIYSSGLPKHFTPYQFRHTVGLVLSEAGVDMRDISDHFGHKHSETTRKHYVPVISSRLERVSRVLDSRKLGWKK